MPRSCTISWVAGALTAGDCADWMLMEMPLISGNKLIFFFLMPRQALTIQ